jgi:hypothetical protein
VGTLFTGQHPDKLLIRKAQLFCQIRYPFVSVLVQ